MGFSISCSECDAFTEIDNDRESSGSDITIYAVRNKWVVIECEECGFSMPFNLKKQEDK